jgi:hypothetical protein
MKGRQPFAINGRRTAVKAFKAAFIRFPKSDERQTAFSHARAGRQNSEGFGGGNRVKK